MKEITEKQIGIVNFIKDFLRDHGYPPTFRDIANGKGISLKGAHDHIQLIEKKGYVSYERHKSRSIKILKEV